MPSARFEWKPYALAVLLVGAATALRFGLSLLDPNVLFFAVFYPAILLAALLGGPGPAILATCSVPLRRLVRVHAALL